MIKKFTKHVINVLTPKKLELNVKTSKTVNSNFSTREITTLQLFQNINF